MALLRRAFSVLVLLQGLPLMAQVASSGWRQVEQLPAGTHIRVRTDRRAVECSFTRADESSLQCEKSSLLHGGRAIVLSRGEVEWVKGSREGLSRLIGVAIAAGAGTGIGAGIDASGSGEDGHLATAVLGILGGILGFAATAHADFLAGPVLYRRS